MRRAPKRCLDAKARQCRKASYQQEGLHEVVPAVGIMGKLHSGLRNPTRTSQSSMLAALNRLPKQLWDLYAAYLQWSYRNSGLGDSQPAGLPRLGKGRLLLQVGVLQEDLQLACPWLGEKRACYTVNTGREHGSLSSRRWHAHCLCLLCKIPAGFCFVGFVCFY